MDNTAYSMLCRKIPTVVRENKLISDSEPILNATASVKDKNMLMLAKIWYEFVEPLSEKNYDCPKCLASILSSWRELRPTLIDLSKEEQILRMI